MMPAAEVILWVSMFLVAHTYFFYPALLAVLRGRLRKPVARADITPSVSLLIAAFNEEKCIRGKIENSLALDYPKDRLEIIVASDCSSDATDDIVREYADRNVRLSRLDHRGGKTVARNHAVTQAKGEILVFSDAPTIYRPDAIRMLVRNYVDASIGCVTGEVVYTNDENSAVGEGGSLYWRYESWIKRIESDIGSVLGAAGCIYSMRRELYMPFNEGGGLSLDDDFLTPLNLYTMGFRSVMDEEAVSIEKASKGRDEEFRMRSRVITRAISGLVFMRRILNPFKYPLYSFELFSHKVLRWAAPVFMMAALFANAAIFAGPDSAPVYAVLLGLQCFFYGAALAGLAMDRLGLPKLKLFYVPYYFCVVNGAVLNGVWKFMIGRRDRVWTPIR